MFMGSRGNIPYMVKDEPLDEHVAQSASDEEERNPEPGPYLGACSTRLHVPAHVISVSQKKDLEGTYVRSWLTLTGAAKDVST